MILFVSDLHVKTGDKEPIEWLKKLVEEYHPEFILSGGDNGDLYLDDLEELGVDFYTVYGNHDTIEWVKEHPKNWLSDGLHILGDWQVLAWNGIVGFSGKWYHKSLDEIVKFGYSWSNTKPDILVMHDVPFTDGKLFRKRIQPYHGAITWMIEAIKPKVVLSGHMHNGVIINEDIFRNSTYVNIESKPPTRKAVLVEKDSSGNINVKVV